MNNATTNSQSAPAPADKTINVSLQFILAILSGVLLALPYNFPDLFYLTWFAFVPVLFAAHKASPGKAYLLGFCTGITFYLLAASWILDFVALFKDYEPLRVWIISIIFWLYCSQLPALLLLATRFLTLRLNLSIVLAFPPLVVLFYRFFPMLFSVQLGESQSRFLTAIQATEFTGVYGLDFIIALVNCLVLAALLPNSVVKSTLSAAVTYTAAIIIIPLWFGYGLYSTVQWDKRVASWDTKKIGFVQPNETPSASLPPAVPGFSYVFPPEMAISEILAKQKPEVIVWPETRFKGYYYYPRIEENFARQIAQLDVPVIFQDVEESRYDSSAKKYNSATLLNKNGDLEEVYRKTKRVPFGEYLPVFGESPTMKNIVRQYFGDFFVDFSAGNEPKTFTTDHLSFVPLLCYEVMFPEYVAKALAGSAQGKILLGLSNNGWFGETLQPYQHLNSSILRTVENRLSMIHVVNNGPSGVILPNGRLVLQTDYHQATAVLIDMPNSAQNGGSFYSKHPYGFLFFCTLLSSLCILLEIIFRSVNSHKFKKR